jgi:hypothetical protein
MPLPPSGSQLSIVDMSIELNKTATATVTMNDSDIRKLLDREGDLREISFLHGWGKSSVRAQAFLAGGNRGVVYGSINVTDTIEGWDFGTDTATLLGVTAASGRRASGGAASPESGDKGYWLGGSTVVENSTYGPYANPTSSKTEGFEFSAQTAFDVAVDLPRPLGGLMSQNQGGGAAGYYNYIFIGVPGLRSTDGPARVSRYIENAQDKTSKFVFSSETSQAVVPPVVMNINLPTGGYIWFGVGTLRMGGFVSTQNDMWGVGGSTIGNPGSTARRFVTTTINRLNLNTDTASAPGTATHRGMIAQSTFSSPSTSTGYMVGGSRIGWPFPAVTDIDAFSFSSETTRPSTAFISSGLKEQYGYTESRVKGYFFSGIQNYFASSFSNRVDGFDFASETNFVSANGLTQGRAQASTIRKR